MTAQLAQTAGTKIAYGSAVYNRIAEFLIEEALQLDENRLKDWLSNLTEDITYTAPLRTTRWNDDPESDIVQSVKHFDDDHTTLSLRVRRLVETKSVWSENPHARTRRFITNISVRDTETPGEYMVTSYVLLMKNRSESSTYQFVTARRNDILRIVDSEMKLAKREFVVDMSVLGVPNLINFL